MHSMTLNGVKPSSMKGFSRRGFLRGFGASLAIAALPRGMAQVLQPAIQPRLMWQAKLGGRNHFLVAEPLLLPNQQAFVAVGKYESGYGPNSFYSFSFMQLDWSGSQCRILRQFKPAGTFAKQRMSGIRGLGLWLRDPSRPLMHWQDVRFFFRTREGTKNTEKGFRFLPSGAMPIPAAEMAMLRRAVGPLFSVAERDSRLWWSGISTRRVQTASGAWPQYDGGRISLHHDHGAYWSAACGFEDLKQIYGAHPNFLATAGNRILAYTGFATFALINPDEAVQQVSVM